MTAEILIYALIAGGLIFWLRSILGTRDEDEEASRPAPPKMELDESGKIMILGQNGQPLNEASAVQGIEELAETPKGNMSIGNAFSKDKLIEITTIDRQFDVHKFLQATQDAFVYVVESFAEGDRETLKDLLGETVYTTFDTAITQREKAGETNETEIHAITKSEIIEVRLDNKTAFITIRFWANETSTVHDENGNLISGHPDKTTEMRDVWTFSRNLKSSDPRWLVVETREDGVGDNELIPNTH